MVEMNLFDMVCLLLEAQIRKQDQKSSVDQGLGNMIWVAALCRNE